MKILIEPQSKRDIEIIEPHLELTPTQVINTFIVCIPMFFMLNLLKDIVGQKVHENMTRFITMVKLYGL